MTDIFPAPASEQSAELSRCIGIGQTNSTTNWCDYLLSCERSVDISRLEWAIRIANGGE